jgi:hypothetical protein
MESVAKMTGNTIAKIFAPVDRCFFEIVRENTFFRSFLVAW